MKRKIFIIMILILFTYSLCIATTKTVDELDDIGVATGDDVMLIIDDPNGTATAKKISKRDLLDIEDKIIICKIFTSAGIQACVDAIGGKGKVLLPKGIYHANSQITLDANDITIEGLGDVTILTDTNDFIPIYHNGYGNITLRNLTINGNNFDRAVGCGPLVYLSVSDADEDGWINIEGCDFINYADSGSASVILSGDGNQQVFNVSNCHFRNMANGTYAIEISNTQSNITRCSFVEVNIGISLYYPRASNVTACTFSRNTGYSIAAAAGGSVSIIGNGFYENSYRDVRMGCQGTLSGNTFRGNTGDYAAYIWSNRECSITANQFYTNDVIADIRLRDVQRCTVTANQFYCDGTTDPNHHIYFSNGDDCVVASNVFDSDVDVAAIYMHTGSSTGNIIYGNINTTISGTYQDFGDFTLYANLVYAGIDEDTISVDPNESPVTYTLTPTATNVRLTCNDPNNCLLSVSETGAEDGQVIEIVNISANSIVLEDSSGVCESSNPTLGQWDTVRLIYASDRWVQHGPVGNN